MAGRIAGIVYLRKNDKLLTLGSGELTCNPGFVKREGILASDSVAGYKETPQIPHMEGEFIFLKELNIRELMDTTSETVTAELANGQTFVLIGAWWAGDGSITSDGIIKFRFEGMKGEFVS